MNVTTVEAEGKLEELLRRAANGEEVVITGPDRSSARLVPLPASGSDRAVQSLESGDLRLSPAILRELGTDMESTRQPLTSEERLAVLSEIRSWGRENARPGPDAAHSQDFLYDEDGLPA